jgi:hypothetical protein
MPLTVSELLNAKDWAAALIQRAEITHETNQRRAAAGAPLQDLECDLVHASTHELTEWEQTWIRNRVEDVHRRHLNQKNEGLAVLAESEADHLARELLAKAMNLFGDSHDITRSGLQKVLLDLESNRGQLLDSEYQSNRQQIETYLDLVERHIATVTTEVTALRETAQSNIDTCNRLLAISFADHLTEAFAYVQNTIRMLAK